MLIIIISCNYFILLWITISMEIQRGCRMDGLRKTCVQTIHGYYILWLKIPFLCVYELLLYETIWESLWIQQQRLDMMCGMNTNNNNSNIVSFVLLNSSLDILSLTTTPTAVSWVQRVFLAIAGDGVWFLVTELLTVGIIMSHWLQ